MAATPRTRRTAVAAAAACYLLSLPFLILVLAGNTRAANAVLADIYFFRLDVSQIIPIAVANSQLLNSVARSLGLHDFYQVGLWSFCEGYNDEGVTFCSQPVQFYWFNPVEILVGELLAGAKIALPAAATAVLGLLRAGSQAMYVCFLVGAVLCFVLVFATPLVLLRSRVFTLLVAAVAFLAALALAIGAVIATVISLAAKIALTAQDQLNIRASVGTKMFAFMWIATIFAALAFLLHAALGCCCRPDRRLRAVQSPSASVPGEKKAIALPDFVRRRWPTAV